MQPEANWTESPALTSFEAMDDMQTGCFSFLTSFRRIKRSHHSPIAPQPNSRTRANTVCEKSQDGKATHLGIPCACDLGGGDQTREIWDLEALPRYTPKPTDSKTLGEIFKPEVLTTIEEELDRVNKELRDLSMKIHDHPEIAYQEKYAHDTLTAFMASHGFEVTKHYLGLETAWRASFSYGKGGRTIGVNSEMDALPGVGHACGHNLIAIVGVGISLAIKAALEKHKVSGTVVLLGTPAEEAGAGKARLIERGAYKEMDACVMAHPGPGPAHSAGTGPCRAIQAMTVEFFGHTAHASAAPWEGQNALDAAFVAYSSISALRQQVKPTHRVHGIVEGRDWAPNIIPDYAKMRWIARAPTSKEVEELRERLINCFKGAALATSTKYKISMDEALYDLVQNEALADDFTAIMNHYGSDVTLAEGAIGGSTDFGNVTHVVPGLHPSYAIPTKPNGGNHTVLFTEAAATGAAHDASIRVAKALAHAGFRVIDDDDFYKKVKDSFENQFRPAQDKQ